MGENRWAGHLCVGKPLILALRIEMKTLKVFIEKVRTTQRWFLPAFAFEHLQHYFGDDLTDFFPHPSLVLYSFATPPIKLNRYSKSVCDHGSQTTWTDHRDGPTFSVTVRSHLI
jgi:hypothetical protein